MDLLTLKIGIGHSGYNFFHDIMQTNVSRDLSTNVDADYIWVD
jgi:hypothetical protein